MVFMSEVKCNFSLNFDAWSAYSFSLLVKFVKDLSSH